MSALIWLPWYARASIARLMKQFLAWIGLKEKLHENPAKPPLVRERDLWWVSFGENVGSEMNGKSKLFSRPAVVLKKLAHGFFLVAPTTTQARTGTWYVQIDFAGRKSYVCLHQIRTIDYRRLSSRIGQIDGDDFKRVKDAFGALYK
jgi:mRNA-degrading endonuclease toxin of MazEF toxin-antitoxin module